MPNDFDLSSAVPVQDSQDSGFDMSSAVPIQQPKQSMQGIIPRAFNAATQQVGSVMEDTGNVMRGQPEAIANFSTKMNTPIPMLQKAKEFVTPQGSGLPRRIAGAMIPQTGIDLAAMGLSSEIPAPKTISAIAQPIEKGINKVGNFVFGSALDKGEKLSKEATGMYRNMLRPDKGEIKNIEIRGNRNIDDYYKLAAEEKLPISQTADKKLDTTDARAMLQEKQSALHDSLNTILSKSDKSFDLNQLKSRAITEMRSKYKNASEYEGAVDDVNSYIDAEIRKYGQTVSATQLNDIKQGMWGVGYDALRPTASKTARTIGHLAKETIEQGVTDKAVKTLNEESGRYATLSHLLENAQGRVIQGGKIGGYVARTVGAIAGHSTGIPIIGPVLGDMAGGKMANAIYAPERTSRIAGTKMAKASELLASGSAIQSKFDKIKNIITQAGGKKPRISDYGDGNKLIEFEGINGTTLTKNINEVDTLDKVKALLKDKIDKFNAAKKHPLDEYLDNNMGFKKGEQ